MSSFFASPFTIPLLLSTNRLKRIEKALPQTPLSKINFYVIEKLNVITFILNVSKNKKDSNGQTIYIIYFRAWFNKDLYFNGGCDGHAFSVTHAFIILSHFTSYSPALAVLIRNSKLNPFIYINNNKNCSVLTSPNKDETGLSAFAC